MSELQQGLYNPEISNVAKETGGNLANIKTNTDTLVSGMATLTAKDFSTQATLAEIEAVIDNFQFDASDYLKVNIAAGGAGDGSILDGVNTAIKATVLDYANSNPLAVRLTDLSGDYIAAGAGTQYTEGDIDATITGSALMWEDAADTLRAVSAAKPLPIGDAGGSITVDGTFWQSTQPISAASLPLPTGAATSALQGGGLPAALGASGGLKVDGSGTALPVTGTITAVTAITNALPAGTNAIGKLLPPDIDVTTHTNYARKYYTSAGAVTDGIIWSPAAGKRWHIVSIFLQVSAAATVTLEDDLAAGDSAVWKAELAANSGWSHYFGEKYPLASGEDVADLIITTSAGNVYCTVVGYEI